ncbi:hypothetical protein JCM3765_003421 [Sporobolomyces pararoseus]
MTTVAAPVDPSSNDANLPPHQISSSTSTTGTGITEDEAALYDRQLRLWGVEAQNRMRESNVLLCGSFKGISTEVSKNIVLAGVGRVGLCDIGKVEWKDLGSGYWEREEDIGKYRVEVVAPRLQLLNPRVQITTHTLSEEELLKDENFLNGFDLIVVTDTDAKTIVSLPLSPSFYVNVTDELLGLCVKMKMNQVTRKLGKKFFASSSIGIHGWVFADLLKHDFIIDEQKSSGPGEPTKVVPLKLSHNYCSFEQALTKHDFSKSGQKKLRKKLFKKREVLWAVLTSLTLELELEQQSEQSEQSQSEEIITLESFKKKSEIYLTSIGVDSKTEILTQEVISRFLKMKNHEFAPSCAIVGGVLGQDVLNAVGGKEEPVRNLMVFDGDLGEAGVWALGC